MEIMETFIENQGVISGNNATIAANQMKVYEAGVRAGLAQDPDYQEGYEDGRDAALGGAEWKDILNGNTPVGRAKMADRAIKADLALQADLATNATRAEMADRASKADRAAEADEAANAATADRARGADLADEASHAQEAAHAASADYATSAGHATAATYANGSERAGTAALADEATYARNAPVWNVERFVGAISPSIDMAELVAYHNSSSSPDTLERVSEPLVIPMINAGELYLDFKTKTEFDGTDSSSDYPYTITDKVDIYLNDELVKTYGRTYDSRAEFGGFGVIETDYRHLLSVRVGDVVTVKATIKLTPKDSYSPYDKATLTVVGVQLKANIITAHTYPTWEVEA